MRNLKRVLSLALALVMVLGMMVIGTSAATFTDAEEITKEEAVEVLAAIGMVQGSNGAFNPNGTFTREAAAKLITYMKIGPTMAEKLAGTEVFNDVDKDRWSAKYIGYCANLGYITGNGDGSFNPEGELTDIALGKLLLCAALGKDASKYVGDNWATAVTVDMLDAGLVESVSGTVISREDACDMILTAMKMTSTPEIYNVIKDNKVVKSCTDLLDAYLYAEILGGTVEQAPATDSLLYATYGVTYDEAATDKFGRPGIRYTDIATKGKKVNVFIGAETVAEYVGEVKGGTLFADLGEPETIAVTIYNDGEKLGPKSVELTTAAIAEDSKANAVQASINGTPVALTGNGVATEVYETAKDAYTIVVVNTYADTVKKVTKADAEKEIKACTELTGGLKYESEDFAEKDAVLYTVAKGEIQKIWKNENTVKGVITKIAKGVYTIGGAEYKDAYTSSATLTMNGKEGEWFVDAYGNLIADKVVAKEETKDEWIYAVVLDAAGSEYVPAQAGSLIEAGKDAKDAKEVIKVKTAADEVLTLDTAWEYVLDEDDKWVSTTFVNGGKTPIHKAGDLIRYTVDKDGKVAKIEAASATPAAGEFVKGKATVSGWSGILADDTAIFLTDGKKYEVYTGYANVPNKTFTGATFFGGSGAADKAFDAILVTVDSVTVDTKGDDVYVFVAGTECTTEWDAEANKGEGAVVYVYEDLYVDGVKTALTFETEQTLKKGEMYAYNTKSKNITATNVLTGTAKVTSIQSAYFLAGDVVYTDADTAYVQIDAAKGTIAEATGLPAIKDYTVTILKVDVKDDVATTVFFSAEKIEK